MRRTQSVGWDGPGVLSVRERWACLARGCGAVAHVVWYRPRKTRQETEPAVEMAGVA
jgi:hypothetical protein